MASRRMLPTASSCLTNHRVFSFFFFSRIDFCYLPTGRRFGAVCLVGRHKTLPLLLKDSVPNPLLLLRRSLFLADLRRLLQASRWALEYRRLHEIPHTWTGLQSSAVLQQKIVAAPKSAALERPKLSEHLLIDFSTLFVVEQ